MSSSKLIALGSTTLVVSAAVAVAIGQVNSHFQNTAGFWIAVGAFVVGAVVLVLGLVKRDGGDTPEDGMTQTAGDHSAQYQSRGDINISDRSPDPR